MILSNTKLEFRALRTICGSSKKNDASKLLAILKKNHFFDEGAEAVFDHIKKIARKEGHIPSWTELATSPKLPDSIRVEVNSYRKIKPLNKTAAINNLYENLEEYRKSRVLYHISEDIQNTLQKDKVDIDKLYKEVHQDISSNSVSSNNEIKVTTIGTGSKGAKELLHYLLYEDKKGELLPTGFAAFDSENGGLPKSGLTVIAATTGGGKSAMMVQMARNMAEAGKRVHCVPLEMSEKELGARIMANIAEVDVRKYIGALPLSVKERKKSERAWTQFEKDLKAANGALRIYEPDEDLVIEDLLNIVLPYDDDVIFVDYIGLLGGIEGDDQWHKLGAIARYCKRWATLHGKNVILLAQLSDEGVIRYSKAIKDHANNMWSWVFAEQNREMGEIMVMQQKARNQRMFDFPLAVDFATMKFKDVNDYAPSSKAIDKIERHIKRVRKSDRETEKRTRRRERSS